jgi:hypothetical protein
VNHWLLLFRVAQSPVFCVVFCESLAITFNTKKKQPGIHKSLQRKLEIAQHEKVIASDSQNTTQKTRDCATRKGNSQ